MFAHNIKLGLALDDVNPFKDLRSCHSTWFLVLLNYNHPPWLVIKHYFLMLALIILGKGSYTCNDVDVHLQALIKELQVLWKCV